MIWKCLCFFARTILSLRYKIEVRGMDRLKEFGREGGMIFLPNHPAHMDPLMIELLLWPRYRMRPIVIEYIYRQKLILPFMKVARALSMPNFESSVNEIKVKKAESIVVEVSEGLKRGENFLLYPSGRLKNTGKEVVGGASAAHTIIRQSPQARVVLIRTTGLWGSSFSRALTGHSPDLQATFLRNVKVALKNFIFFMPRRKILIEIEPEPQDFPKEAVKLDFNRYLERWYNRYPDGKGGVYETEPLYLVSYSRWREELPEVFVPKKKQLKDLSISDETKAKIYTTIARIIEKPGFAFLPEMNLALDLGMDSLQIAELVAFIGHEYDLQELHPEDVETIQSVLEVAEGARIAEPPAYQLMHARWPEENGKRPDPSPPEGKSISEAFLRSCDRMGSLAACADDLVGVLTYKRMKKSALVLAEEFKKIPQKHLGIMLPASSAAYLLIFAIQLAGKVPVMLNWTLGSRSLDEMVKLSKIETVFTSWRFLERLSHVEFGLVADRIRLLEDVRQNLSLKAKLRGLFLSFLKTSVLMKFLNTPDQNAVILFTSGTESAPKGVPLTHKNILSNQRSGMECFELKSSDIFYGILPPFHSFGFSLVGIFPILIGVRIAFYPDPTDSFALAEGIERWRATILCSAPSFLKGLFLSAKKRQLSSIRFFVSGAEKASPDLYDQVAKLKHAALIEGYGITECSPILTMNRQDLPPKGVGRPIPGLEFCTIHPETLEVFPEGTEGEICVRGPNVFKGYLSDVKDPFIEIDGKKWYRTGDIGYFDKNHNLILSGRLKRFTKIGGEMISLGAIEEVLSTEFLKRNMISSDVTNLAVCADEQVPEKAQLVLFTTFAIEKDAVNEILRQSGVSRIIKISQIYKIPEIPLLGVGKTDYRRLQQLYNHPSKSTSFELKRS